MRYCYIIKSYLNGHTAVITGCSVSILLIVSGKKNYILKNIPRDLTAGKSGLDLHFPEKSGPFFQKSGKQTLLFR